MASFTHTYERPDFDAVRQRSRALADACATASSPEAFLSVVDEWNRVRATVDTHMNLAMVMYAQDTTAPANKTEQAFWDAAAPDLKELDVAHANALLESRFHSALDERYGAQLLALKRCERATFVPAIADTVAQEARLCSAYQQLMARSEVEFRGERMNLSKLGGFLDRADRQTRMDAQRARAAFLAANAEELDRIFDELVHLRHAMARALGDDDYVPLAYRLRRRTSYGPDDVARFRASIVREIVPLATELHARQADTLGVERLLFHDESVWRQSGNVRPIGDRGSILASAQSMYDELHPDMGAFFRVMIERELLDVETRDGKSRGGFCTHFNDLGLPFIFANFNGSDADIMVITHECGHAFQAYSSRDIEPRVEYMFPTFEAAEIHSKSMEFLTHPWMERFFGEHAEAYRQTHVRRAICLLPYTVCVDHFQHDVYQNPTWSPSDRKRRWRQLEQLYLPHRDYGGMYPYYETGGLWQRQLHIYRLPFYYIDYALAEACAMQLWRTALDDRARALEQYLMISRVGGRLSFVELLQLGGLRSPFEDDCIVDVGQFLRAHVT